MDSLTFVADATHAVACTLCDLFSTRPVHKTSETVVVLHLGYSVAWALHRTIWHVAQASAIPSPSWGLLSQRQRQRRTTFLEDIAVYIVTNEWRYFIENVFNL